MISSIKQTILVRLRFIQSFIQFKNYLKKVNFSSTEEMKQRVSNSYIIILSPWSLTSTPWFAIGVALLLHKRNHKIQFLIDNLPFENSTDNKLQINLIRIALSSLRKFGVKIENLSDFSNIKTISENEQLGIEKLAFANAIHKNRGEEDTPYFKSLCKKNKKLLRTNFPFVKSFV